MKEKTFTKIKLLGRLKWVLDRETLLLLYNTLILPIINYGDFIYHNMSQQDCYSLQKLQNTACHAILRADIRTAISDMHDDLEIDMLYQRHCQHIAIRVYQFVNGLGPTSCNEMMGLFADIHDRTTRSPTDLLLHVPQTRLRVTDNDFYVIDPKVWNQLPSSIRNIETLERF